MAALAAPSQNNPSTFAPPLAGRLPFSIPASAPPPMAALLRGCLSADPSFRPSFAAILGVVQAMLRELQPSPATQALACQSEDARRVDSASVSTPDAAESPAAALAARVSADAAASLAEPRCTAGRPAGPSPDRGHEAADQPVQLGRTPEGGKCGRAAAPATPFVHRAGWTAPATISPTSPFAEQAPAALPQHHERMPCSPFAAAAAAPVPNHSSD